MLIFDINPIIIGSVILLGGDRNKFWVQFVIFSILGVTSLLSAIWHWIPLIQDFPGGHVGFQSTTVIIILIFHLAISIGMVIWAIMLLLSKHKKEKISKPEHQIDTNRYVIAISVYTSTALFFYWMIYRKWLSPSSNNTSIILNIPYFLMVFCLIYSLISSVSIIWFVDVILRRKSRDKAQIQAEEKHKLSLSIMRAFLLFAVFMTDSVYLSMYIIYDLRLGAAISPPVFAFMFGSIFCLLSLGCLIYILYGFLKIKKKFSLKSED